MRNERKGVVANTKPESQTDSKSHHRLAEYPEHGDALKWDLQGLRRVRVGSYRIIYKVQFDMSIIQITHIAHRKDVYQSK